MDVENTPTMDIGHALYGGSGNLIDASSTFKNQFETALNKAQGENYKILDAKLEVSGAGVKVGNEITVPQKISITISYTSTENGESTENIKKFTFTSPVQARVLPNEKPIQTLNRIQQSTEEQLTNLVNTTKASGVAINTQKNLETILRSGLSLNGTNLKIGSPTNLMRQSIARLTSTFRQLFPSSKKPSPGPIGKEAHLSTPTTLASHLQYTLLGSTKNLMRARPMSAPAEATTKGTTVIKYNSRLKKGSVEKAQGDFLVDAKNNSVGFKEVYGNDGSKRTLKEDIRIKLKDKFTKDELKMLDLKPEQSSDEQIKILEQTNPAAAAEIAKEFGLDPESGMSLADQINTLQHDSPALKGKQEARMGNVGSDIFRSCDKFTLVDKDKSLKMNNGEAKITDEMRNEHTSKILNKIAEWSGVDVNFDGINFQNKTVAGEEMLKRIQNGTTPDQQEHLKKAIQCFKQDFLGAPGVLLKSNSSDQSYQIAHKSAQNDIEVRKREGGGYSITANWPIEFTNKNTNDKSKSTLSGAMDIDANFQLQDIQVAWKE